MPSHTILCCSCRGNLPHLIVPPSSGTFALRGAFRKWPMDTGWERATERSRATSVSGPTEGDLVALVECPRKSRGLNWLKGWADRSGESVLLGAPAMTILTDEPEHHCPW